jgi:hypothetical protein
LFARCEAEAKRRFGQPAVSDKLPKSGLKKLRGSQPVFPKLPPGTQGDGIAMHEVLVGPDGTVQEVWSVRQPTFEPAFPAFSEAIVVALKTWEYEPHHTGGEAVAACILVKTNIHWR